MRTLLWLAVSAWALAAATPEYKFKVVHIYPHDATSFTQGFEYHNGLLYEGTGLEGHSHLRVEHLETGKVIRQIAIDERLFGEGITLLHGHIYQLTWLAGKGFVYDASTFHKLSEFSYPGQGWGLTNDGKSIYMSDGTSEIRVWDGQSLKDLRHIQVHDGDQAVNMLNELEWIRGEIWANVWQTDRIARISPADGHVIAWINAAGLLKPSEATNPDAVLNGIAYDSRHNRIFITGKLWPKIFEVRVVTE